MSLRRNPLRVDFAMYAQAVPLLLRHPSIFVMPLLAAVVDLLVSQITPFFTNAVGGAGSWLFGIIINLAYGFCFGVAVIAANDVWRSRRATFDDAWEEGRRKAGGILIATIGFYFLLYVAQYAGMLLGSTILQIVLQIVVAFFLIYTIPAAAIGGMPGNLAIGASFRAVRANPLGAAILAIVFVVLWIWLPYAVAPAGAALGPIAYELILAAVKAIVLAYLAFPFAKQYDDVAFRGYW
ncbi:MAG: hypothetical protein JOZ77_10275 [Candidatus Eremiobacteraeota bacterium]|nr:hypothetical protein [Candidatus Eremiobacteraeota bacterium]